jgi:hypothetical protein
MARAIIRYSLDGDASNQTGNEARSILEGAGFDRIGTASFEGDCDQAAMLATLEQLIDVLRRAPGGGTLDHLWVYVDVPPTAAT